MPLRAYGAFARIPRPRTPMSRAVRVLDDQAGAAQGGVPPRPASVRPDRLGSAGRCVAPSDSPFVAESVRSADR